MHITNVADTVVGDIFLRKLHDLDHVYFHFQC